MNEPFRNELCLYFCTCPDLGSAERIAEALLDGRLAACVSLLPGLRSLYRWQGQIESSEEVQLLIKSRHSHRPAISALLADLHPYELPELIAVDIASGLPEYLAWLAAETRPDSPSADMAP